MHVELSIIRLEAKCSLHFFDLFKEKAHFQQEHLTDGMKDKVPIESEAVAISENRAVQDGSAILRGRVWWDDNGTFTMEEDEQGMEGVVVSLW